MRLFHADPVRSAVFDEPNLVSCAGLVPVLGLAQRAGLSELAQARLTVPGGAGHAAGLKVSALVAGMVAGADSISDMGLLRHGGMGRLFTDVRAPSTLGTFLRAFTFGHVRQLDAVASRFLTGLVRQTPVLPGADQIAFLDIDDTVKSTHGYAKQGAGYGYTGVKGLNALIATVSTPLCAPMIVATRLRKGSTNSTRGAARLISDALKTARGCGAGGILVIRADSAYYGREVIAAAHRGGARFSITARKGPAVLRAISAIPDTGWTRIEYPNAVFDEQLQQWISDAEVAEVPFTAFTSRPQREQISARLIVRRVRDANPAHTVTNDQGELFPAWRHHALFTDTPQPMLDAEADHRRHAIIEQVHADLKAGPLAHLPSGSFAANSAWLILAAIAFNLTRATGALAGNSHAKAVTATIRGQLINIPCRVSRSARKTTLRLPTGWPWQHAFDAIFTASLSPPATT
ncbi:MAG: IS1380 family transposase [Actinomycetota bacterium]|nr:IS1380 family transposase [Actinomycetota bacterium]MDQ2956040.1 IS1380 family transposase [Actinomycetota bacterium]